MSSTETKTGSLAGLKVIDLTRVLGGPYCTQILGDHGATVLKVEPPQGDETRDWGPPFEHGLSAYFAGLNRNKRAMALDLSKPQGRDVLMRLLADADVFFENYKIGTLEGWGIGPDELQKRFPRLVHARISGFGDNGPFGKMPGYDGAVQAWSGLISINGNPESGPVRMGISVVDMVTGLYAANGILMALRERERSGKGQFLEVALYDAAISILLPYAHNWLMSGKAPTMQGNTSPNISPYDLFKTKTESLFLATGNDRQFHRLCDELGKPELGKDPRFTTNADRVKNRAALRAALEDAFASVDGKELATKMMHYGVPAGAALSIPDVLQHPQTIARDMVVQTGRFRGTGIPVKMSRTPGSPGSEPPAFGADSRAVLAEAGYSDAEIDALIESGVVPRERKALR